MIQKYQAIWNREYYSPSTDDKPISAEEFGKIVGIEFFSRSNGYDEDDIENIKAMEIGQVRHINLGHSIVRIEPQGN